MKETTILFFAVAFPLIELCSEQRAPVSVAYLAPPGHTMDTSFRFNNG